MRKDQEDLEGNLIAHPGYTLESPVELLKHTAVGLDPRPVKSESLGVWPGH